MSRRYTTNNNNNTTRRRNNNTPAALPTHLDPSVASLLHATVLAGSSDQFSESDLRVTMAQIKLQQSRLRGNSDYAAKVMDAAIAEGARDREAWTLLQGKLDDIQAAIDEHNHQNNNTTTTTSTHTNNNAYTTSSNEIDPDSDHDDDDHQVDDKTQQKLNDLKEQLLQEQARSQQLEQAMAQSYYAELRQIRSEQADLQDRHVQLRNRLTQLDESIQGWEPSAVASVKGRRLDLDNDNDDDDEKKKEKHGTTTTTKQKSNQTKNDQTIDNSDDDDDDDDNDETDSEDEHDKNDDNTTIITKPALQDALNDTLQNQKFRLLHVECIVCHEQTATRAVIPCGHLCLCDQCVKTLESLTVKQCPLCRGHLLSTLHIYTSQ